MSCVVENPYEEGGRWCVRRTWDDGLVTINHHEDEDDAWADYNDDEGGCC